MTFKYDIEVSVGYILAKNEWINMQYYIFDSKDSNSFYISVYFHIIIKYSYE